MPTRKKPFNDYRIDGDVAYLAITNRAGELKHEVMVDIPDLRRLEEEGARWSSCRGGNSSKTHYCIRFAYVDGHKHFIQLHRYLMAPADDKVVDHLNWNGLDCRRTNMRVCTQLENSRNRAPIQNTATGIRGLIERPSKKFPYKVKLGRGGETFNLRVRTLNIGRITASLARRQHWGRAAA